MATQRVRTVGELAERIARDPELERKVKEDPIKIIAALAAPPQTDVWVYRIVVIALGLIVLGAMTGGIVMAARGSDLPQFIVAVGSAAVGALTGLLAPSPAVTVERHR
ncbi:MAG TPA: hypothetical protein VMT71_11085 [Syntrophorhabdales bacterium]|nr:hypothetical protein [Syntrophorhabdales bacterium]